MLFLNGQPAPITLADDPEQEALDRIAIVSQQAKTAWFGLLAALVFVTVTLMGHEDADFFAYGAATTLPVVGMDVPPEAFFLAAPVLITALYVYLHLYLLNLWEALAEAPPVIRGKPLAKRAYPTMMGAWALRYRNRKRRDGCSPPRTMGWLNGLASLALVWLFGWAVMGALWWISQPAHYWWLTYPLSAMLFTVIAVGARSFASAQRKLSDGAERNGWMSFLWRSAWRVPLFALLAFVSYLRIDGGGLPSEAKMAGWIETNVGLTAEQWIVDRNVSRFRPPSEKHAPFLARASLSEEHLTIRPEDFRERAEWMADFEHQYRQREGIALGVDMNFGQRRRFESDAKIRRKARLDSLHKRALQHRDLRQAYLTDAFLAGADLRRARLEGASLRQAQLEGASLASAHLEGADLSRVRMEGVDLRYAQMEGTILYKAYLEGAFLRYARMQQAVLSHTRMEGADLRFAQMKGASLASAHLEGADLYKAHLEGAYLGGAQMERVNLSGANLKSSKTRGWSIARASLRSADFTGARNLSQRSVNAAFGDTDTILPNGIVRPCHWKGIEPLSRRHPGYSNLSEDSAYLSWLAKWDGDTPPPCPEEDAGGAE